MANASGCRDPAGTDHCRRTTRNARNDSLRVNESEAGRSALEAAAELSDRLGLRLVVAHVADGIPPVSDDGNGDESVTTRANREGAARLVARLAAEHGLTGSAEQRSAVGDPAGLLGQIAAEEAADMIVLG